MACPWQDRIFLMQYIRIIALLLSSLLLLPSAFANPQSTLLKRSGAYPSNAALETLSQHPQWLHLLHYHQVGLFSPYESQADDPNFFLAENGKTDPLAELLATLDVFKANDNTAHCSYPARFHWLEQQLTGTFPEKNPCPEYQDWRDELAPDGLTLVFPAAYLNSPSSMFGHTLIRIDSTRHSNPLLDYSVNYAANADPTDSELVFTYKGLSGGYPGVFSVLPYYEKVKEYSHLEARDVWEYKLDITKEELEQFVRHVWEVKDTHFDYFFFTENCSYHLLTLLDAAGERFNLADGFFSDVIPADTVRALTQNGFVTEAEFRPSSLSKMQSMQAQMSQQQVVLAKNLAHSSPDFSEELNKLSNAEQAQVLDLAHLYTRYLANKDRNAAAQLSKTSLSLLSKRSKIPQAEAFLPLVPPKTRDDEGHRSHRIQVGVGRALDNNYIQLGLRMAYHDWLDTLAGYIPGARLEMFHLQLRQWHRDDNKTQLEQLRFIDIASLTPRNELFKPLSWYVSTGLKRNISYANELSPFLNGGAGLSYAWDNQLFSMLADTELNADNDIQSGYRFALGPKLVWLSQFDDWSASIELSRQFDIAGARFELSNTKFGVSKQLNQHWQVRLETQYQDYRAKEQKDAHDFSARASIMRYF